MNYVEIRNLLKKYNVLNLEAEIAICLSYADFTGRDTTFEYLCKCIKDIYLDLDGSPSLQLITDIVAESWNDHELTSKNFDSKMETLIDRYYEEV